MAGQVQPFWQTDTHTLYPGDNLQVMAQMPDNSVDAIVTDPPYGLEFMGKEWDSFGRQRDYKARGEEGYGDKGLLPHYGRGGRNDDVARFKQRAALAFQEFSYKWAVEAYRVLKPGGWLFAFGGTRTVHRLTNAVEDAGFEVRDRVLSISEGGEVESTFPVWVFGSGFPKGLNISVAIDKELGFEPENGPIFAPVSPQAQLYHDYNVALKPAHEPIVLARKPLEKGLSVAQNVLKWGTGGLNIGAGRIGETKRVPGSLSKTENKVFGKGLGDYRQTGEEGGHNPNVGRWPANVIHSGTEGVLQEFAEYGEKQSGTGEIKISHGTKREPGWAETKGLNTPGRVNIGVRDFGDTGSVARYFQVCPPDEYDEQELEAVARVVNRFLYHPKASKRDRDEGLNGLEEKRGGAEQFDSRWKEGEGDERKPLRRNSHPTVKPTSLMRELVRLALPPNPDAVILDPFNGSGSTGKACALEGVRYIGIEREEEYCAISVGRIEYALQSKGQLVPARKLVYAKTRTQEKVTPDLPLFADLEDAV